VSCHARIADQLDDRGEHEDAEQSKKTRGGERVIGVSQDYDGL